MKTEWQSGSKWDGQRSWLGSGCQIWLQTSADDAHTDKKSRRRRRRKVREGETRRGRGAGKSQASTERKISTEKFLKWIKTDQLGRAGPVTWKVPVLINGFWSHLFEALCCVYKLTNYTQLYSTPCMSIHATQTDYDDFNDNDFNLLVSPISMSLLQGRSLKML